MKNIGIFTSSRSDYGILSKIIDLFEKSKNYNLKLFVCGSHLSKSYGNTIDEIKKNKISNLIKLKNINIKNKDIDVSKSYINLTNNFFQKIKLKKNSIKLIILLGDRYELLPIANLCFLEGIKIVHIHGGELTEGAIDNFIRNSVSMLSIYHMVATKKSKKRLIDFGINKKNIFLIGALGLEGISENLLSKSSLENKLKFNFYKQNIMITYHPETILIKNNIKNLKSLLNALKFFKKTRLIFTAPGADMKSLYIKKKILNFVKKNKNSIYFDSLGHSDYLSILNNCDLSVGNSSSGIIEAPSLNIFSLDIGNRQKGRERSKSVINIKFNKKLIIFNIKKYLRKNKLKKINNPYQIIKSPSRELLRIINKIY